MNNAMTRAAMTFLADYTCVYDVDLKTDRYECFNVHPGGLGLALSASGEAFFKSCQRDICDVVFEEDRQTLSAVLERDALTQKLSDENEVSYTYRLEVNGKPVYHSMRILRERDGGEDRLIIGVRNIDASVRMEQATRTYNDIAMHLAHRYATIYYVDLSTNHYVEYSSSDDYKDLNVPPEGTDFFTASRENAQRYIHPEDATRVSDLLEKEHMMEVTALGRTFQTEYRLIMNGEAHHVRLRADRTQQGNHLIIALENIDQEVQRQQELQEVSERNLIFTHIAESLANQYGMIYYVDAETDEYIEFTSAGAYKELNISPIGTDFFGTSQRNVGMIVHPSDRERVFAALDKQTMLAALREKGSFTTTYQLLLAEGSSYTRMTVFWANDQKHLIMGVMNIDNEIQRENVMKKMMAENTVFSQIAESLANQYDTIYYVDMLTDHYLEFSSTDVYKSLEVRPSGDDFFAEALANIDRVIYPEDREDIHRILNKAGMIQLLQGKHMLTHTYRLMIGENNMYARMSIIWATDNKHMIIGVMNIDQEVKREKEVQQQLHVANEKAYRDELTGVKNKGAYKELEAVLDDQISANKAGDFSIVVCDVNGLKLINDHQGHMEGDAYIKSACTLICHVWTHSPVFRIGGDEFAVVLQGEDYAHRDALLEMLKSQALKNRGNGDVVVAAGMADYEPGRDASVASVFERADSRMYENKSVLKT